jgi:arylsulfatase A-like enzyme/Tfp pilus assembly protein PilF
VILVTVDTLRADATGFSGAGKALTPLADRLAAGGRVFRFAHSHSVVTLPSHTSILTGLYPYEHGVRDNSGYVLDPGLPTLAGLLRDAGWATGAFVSAFTLDRRFGLDSGFDVYDDAYDGYGGPGLTPPERPGKETVRRALAWWKENQENQDNQENPRFLWVHLFTPHFPYTPEEPFASRHPDQPYYGDAEMADSELEPLLAPLLDAADDRTVVIYTSDHGEGLGEHGEMTHGLFAYEGTLHVPLVIRAPGLVEPGVSEVSVAHVDLLPTVVALVGVEPPDDASGTALFDARGSTSRTLYFESLSPFLNRGWAPLTGRLAGREKAIHLPLPELYDLAADPAESSNLARDRPERLEELLEGIPEVTAERGPIDPETVRRLQTLGYVTGTPAAAAFDAAHDPKNLIHLDAGLARALGHVADGAIEDAIAVLEELIERAPGMELSYGHLAHLYTELGRLDESIAVLQRALSNGVDTEAVRRRLALNLMQQGSALEARAALAPHDASRDPETQSALGRIAAELGEPLEARARFERALAIDPTFPTATMDLGILHLTAGQFDEARRWLERALEQDPYLPEAWNGLGAIHASAGRREAAVRAWRRAVEIDPRMTDALYNLGVSLAEIGDRAGAVEALERYARLVEGPERQDAERLLRRLRGS